MIGRPLRPGEIVHHKDGNILNNDPVNLEMLSSHRNIAAQGFGKKKGGEMMNISSKGAALLMEMG